MLYAKLWIIILNRHVRLSRDQQVNISTKSIRNSIRSNNNDNDTDNKAHILSTTIMSTFEGSFQRSAIIDEVRQVNLSVY